MAKGRQLNTNNRICEICFYDHGVTKSATYKCVTNLGKDIYVCDRCFKMYNVIYVHHEKINQ